VKSIEKHTDDMTALVQDLAGLDRDRVWPTRAGQRTAEHQRIVEEVWKTQPMATKKKIKIDAELGVDAPRAS